MNSTTLTSVLGLGQAIAIAAVTFYTTSSEDGTLNLKSPMFWTGLVVAILVSVKAYYTQGVPTAPGSPINTPPTVAPPAPPVVKP